MGLFIEKKDLYHILRYHHAPIMNATDSEHLQILGNKFQSC